MDVRLALLTILAAIPSTGCPLGSCDAPEEHFEIDEAQTATEVDKLVKFYGLSSWDELECDDVCSDVYAQIRGWETRSIGTCELTLPENPDGSGEPGHVTCSGTGIEYSCGGRRPLGHVERGVDRRGDALARALAAMAHLELTSVFAFEQLAEQLSGWEARRAPCCGGCSRRSPSTKRGTGSSHGTFTPGCRPGSHPSTWRT